MTPGVPRIDPWMRDAVEEIFAAVIADRRIYGDYDLNKCAELIASEYSKAHPPAGESAGTDWKQLLMNVLNALEGRKEGWLSPAQHTKVLKEANEALNADVRAGESAHEDGYREPENWDNVGYEIARSISAYFDSNQDMPSNAEVGEMAKHAIKVSAKKEVLINQKAKVM